MLNVRGFSVRSENPSEREAHSTQPQPFLLDPAHAVINMQHDATYPAFICMIDP